MSVLISLSLFGVVYGPVEVRPVEFLGEWVVGKRHIVGPRRSVMKGVHVIVSVTIQRQHLNGVQVRHQQEVSWN